MVTYDVFQPARPLHRCSAECRRRAGRPMTPRLTHRVAQLPPCRPLPCSARRYAPGPNLLITSCQYPGVRHAPRLRNWTAIAAARAGRPTLGSDLRQAASLQPLKATPAGPRPGSGSRQATPCQRRPRRGPAAPRGAAGGRVSQPPGTTHAQPTGARAAAARAPAAPRGEPSTTSQHAPRLSFLPSSAPQTARTIHTNVTGCETLAPPGSQPRPSLR